MRYLIIISFLISSFALEANWKSDRESLDHVLIKDKFRVFYTLQGRHQLPSSKREDSNLDGTPDYIEELATRLIISDYIFKDIFKFRHPLDSPRYKDKAKFIDVHILTSKNKGSAGDAIIYFNYQYFPGLSESVITMRLSNTLNINNMTPTHELFHLYQNGYTMFKNRWYTEGMARWSEHLFKKGVGKRKPLPRDLFELETVLNKTYGSSTFWHQLAYLFDENKGSFELPVTADKQVKKLFLSIVKDNSIYGYSFIRRFLEELDFMDDFASYDYEVENYKWKEKLQKSPLNNRYILCGLKNTLLKDNKSIVSLNEVKQFILVMDEYMGTECIFR